MYIKLLASAKKHFTGRVTVVLLNQLEDKNHRFITTVSFTKKRVGSLVRLVNTTDIIHSSNPNIRYIENDDIICFKVLVEEASKPNLGSVGLATCTLIFHSYNNHCSVDYDVNSLVLHNLVFCIIVMLIPR